MYAYASMLVCIVVEENWTSNLCRCDTWRVLSAWELVDAIIPHKVYAYACIFVLLNFDFSEGTG